MVRYSKDKEGIPPYQPKELATHLVPRLRGCKLILVKTLMTLSITFHSAPASEAEDILQSIPSETLKRNKVLRVIKKNLVKERLEMSPEIHEKKFGTKLGVAKLYVLVGVADAADLPLNILPFREPLFERMPSECVEAVKKKGQ